MYEVSLDKIDPKILEDQKFLYDILKFRWTKASLINIKYKHSTILPSFENHVKYINSDEFKVFYRIKLFENTIGMIYLNKNNVSGIFMPPALLKKALKNVKQNNILDFDPTPICARAHYLLFAKHPEIELFYASVNPENKLSLRSLIDHGYEIVEITLAIRTKNGIILQES